MKRGPWLVLGLVLGSWSWPAHADDSIRIVVKGSDTIGEHLGRDLAREYMAKRSDVRVRWESIGSSSAFVGLLEGSADLGASSRAIKPAELDQARELRIELSEHVLGYDGIAVIVHPSNPVEALDVAQLASLFTSEAPLWSSVGGPAQRVRRLSRPSYSGTHAFFKDTVVRAGDPKSKTELAAATELIEETDEILSEVARDPMALSYVGLGFVDTKLVKVVPIRADASSPAVMPSARSIRDGSYPIYRPLFLYVREPAASEVRELIAFALSSEGRARVAANAFIPPDVAPMPELPDVAAKASRPPTSEPLRILFAFGSSAPHPDATSALATIVAALRTEKYVASVVGHSDSMGSAAANRAISRVRADAVARLMLEQGAPPQSIRIDARSFDEPAATNTTPRGRRQNRRVDVFLIPIDAR